MSLQQNITQTLSVTPIQTAIFHAREDLVAFIISEIPPALICERMILAITSKVVSLAEGQLVANTGQNKKQLIEEQADHNLGEIGHGVMLTIKHGLMLASAGIDESNSEYGDYILYPKDPFKSANDLRRQLMKHWNLKELGVIITDSRTGPLRLGVVGVSLAFSGFHPVKNLIGHEDIFKKPLKITKVNLVDSLAAAAVLMMGEAAERCPLALIKNASVEFTNSTTPGDLLVEPAQDMYLPLYGHLLK